MVHYDGHASDFSQNANEFATGQIATNKMRHHQAAFAVPAVANVLASATVSASNM